MLYNKLKFRKKQAKKQVLKAAEPIELIPIVRNPDFYEEKAKKDAKKVQLSAAIIEDSDQEDDDDNELFGE